MRIAALCAAALLPLLCVAARCTPSPVPPPPPISDEASVPVTGDAGDTGDQPPAPAPSAIERCLENFQALNPGEPADKLIAVFCSTPEDLAPWTRGPAIKSAH